jgi:CheY-like chemotaxis protein
MKIANICFHPTKVIVLDDSVEFLKSLDVILQEDTSHYQFFHSPQTLLQYVNEKYKFNPYTNRWVETIDEISYQHRRIDIDIYGLHKEIYNGNRFEEISCMVIDYEMPSMNGLDLCRLIKNPYIQKILLTGVADERIAVEAFNEGLIHRFILKQDIEKHLKINKAIREAQEKYFNALSEAVSRVICTDYSRPTAIDDPVFINFFQDLIKKHDIIEYYIIEAIGCYLLINSKGLTYGLFLADEHLMQAMESEANYRIGSKKDKILEQMKNREIMLCYHNKDQLAIPEIEEWDKYLFPCEKLEGKKQTYYWSFAENMIDVVKENIKSFKDFKNR